MVDMRKIPQEPAVKVDGWNESTALKICEGWRENLVESVSISGLSRLVALNFERVHGDLIPADRKGERLLPEGSGKADYYQAMVETFLNAVGAEDEDLGPILDSFKKTGMGGLHRQPLTVASTINGLTGTLQYAVAAQPHAKIALSAIQMVLTAINGRLAFASAELRFRNSGTEEVMPMGKADAAPSAKVGPSVLGASVKLLAKLGKISNDVQEMETALAALKDACDAQTNPDQGSAAPRQAEFKLRKAYEDLSIAYAGFCLRHDAKSAYKTASESAKIEFRGNELASYAGYVNGTANLAAAAMAIFAPASVATFGITGAATGLGLLLYAGYQLSTGPSKDGEAKAKRAIVALSKSLDLLGGNPLKQQKDRADAYRAYLVERRDPKMRADARQKLLDKLDRIAQGDSTQDDLQPLRNWLDYADHRKRTAHATAEIEAEYPLRLQAAGTDKTAVEGLETERRMRLKTATQSLDEEFARAHEARFNPGTIIDAWKTPHRMRFDSMGRLLLGKVSASARTLLKFKATAGRSASLDSGPQAMMREAQLAGKRQELKACLRDWINFSVAQARLKDAAKLSAGDPCLQGKLGSAARALAAIRNPDARALFAGNSREQVEATRLAKQLSAGEQERYTMTMGGSAALGAAVNLTGAAMGLGVNAWKEVRADQGHPLVTHYGDQKDGQILTQGSVPFSGHYSAGERARFQKTEMNDLLKILKRDGDPLKLHLDLSPAETFSPENYELNFKTFDASLDKLLNELETRADIADEITLSIGGAKVASGKLNGTTDYYKWRKEQAPLRTKAAIKGQQARMVAKAMGVAVASPFVQAAAQIPLTFTRKAAWRGEEMSFEVRDKLAEFAVGASQNKMQAKDSAPESADQLGVHEQVRTSTTHEHANTVGTSDAGEPFFHSDSVRLQAARREAQDAVLRIPVLGAKSEPSPTEHAPKSAEYPSLMGAGGGRGLALAWLGERGIEAVHNGGSGMNCLIISLLQHATGRYGSEHEPALIEQAQAYREELCSQGFDEVMLPDARPQMLYDDEPAVAQLLRLIERDHGRRLALHLVVAGFEVDAGGVPRLDGLFRVPRRDADVERDAGADPVAIVQYGNHFEALRGMGRGASFDTRKAIGTMDTRSDDESLFEIDVRASASSARPGKTRSDDGNRIALDLPNNIPDKVEFGWGVALLSPNFKRKSESGAAASMSENADPGVKTKTGEVVRKTPEQPESARLAADSKPSRNIFKRAWQKIKRG